MVEPKLFINLANGNYLEKKIEAAVTRVVSLSARLGSNKSSADTFTVSIV